MNRLEHWEAVYRRRAFDEVSWFRPHLQLSIDLIRRAGVSADARLIDVGGGASTLVDDLLAAGFGSITVLDLSERALSVTRRRLGEAASRVSWLACDITQIDLGVDAFELWHDRAAFHFLVDDAARERYVRALRRALAPGGHVLIAMFDTDGPQRCSGLPVRRYDAAEIDSRCGSDFRLRESVRQIHVTPSGTRQAFRYLWMQAGDAAPFIRGTAVEGSSSK